MCDITVTGVIFGSNVKWMEVQGTYGWAAELHETLPSAALSAKPPVASTSFSSLCDEPSTGMFAHRHGYELANGYDRLSAKCLLYLYF